MTITKMMMTRIPMMVPIIPRFMAGPPLVLLEVPACCRRKPVGSRTQVLIRRLRGTSCRSHAQMPQLRIRENHRGDDQDQ